MRKFNFLGWEFRDEDRYLVLEKELLNPHPPEATLSYKCYSKPERRSYAAAWLISHWYEHALEICPCIQQGDSNNNFRRAFIDVVLKMESSCS
jgi:hypothetical protein